MDFGFYLSGHWADVSRHAVHMYRAMVREAQEAELLGFSSLHIPEHHFMNYLTHPHPLITATRIAAETRFLPIITSVLVLPFYDMRRLAGEIAQTDCLTEGRLQIGVGRGAFAYEFDRFNVDADPQKNRAIFDESLSLLLKLLSETEVECHSDLYSFGPLTITPRPLQKPHPPLWIAALTAPAIYHSAKAGAHVMTMPLRYQPESARVQAEAYVRARTEGGKAASTRFAMLAFVYVAKDAADARHKLEICYTAERRFQNVFTGKGDIRGGDIQPIDIEMSIEEFDKRVIIGTPDQCYEKLKTFADLGVDELVVNMNFGTEHEDVISSQRLLAKEIMPYLKSRGIAVKAS